MQDTDLVPYVRAAAQVVDLPLSPERAQVVAMHFARTVAIARALEHAPLAPEQELAEIYRPAPFPTEDAA